MTPQISVVVPCLVGSKYLDQVIESVLSQQDVQFELIVVFNPHLPTWHHSNVKILSSSLGVNSARNVGLRAAKSDLIYFLDSDCVLDCPHSLSKIVKYFESNLNWAAIGGAYTLPPGSDLPTQAYNYIQNNWVEAHIQNEYGQAPFLLGGNMALRKSKLCGLEFDDKLIFGGTELDFFCRLQKISNQVYYKEDLSVKHLCAVDRIQIAKKATYQASGSQYIEKKGVMFHPKRRNLYAKTPANHLISDIEYYKSKYNSYLESQGKLSYRLRNKIQNRLSAIIERLDLLIQDSKKI